MSNKNAALYPIVLLFISASLIDAHAGVTISDRRYWPNEARGTPGQLIEIRPHSYAYPGSAAGSVTEPRIVPRGRARRPR